jgi:hypothetical protein
MQTVNAKNLFNPAKMFFRMAAVCLHEGDGEEEDDPGVIGADVQEALDQGSALLATDGRHAFPTLIGYWEVETHQRRN